MVRINLINPQFLSDQHLIAEYNEILMLLGYVRKNQSIEPISNYRLGKGHMKFFKDKLIYLKKRHNSLIDEMNRRNFKTNKTVSLIEFPIEFLKDWSPNTEDIQLIKKRLKEKIIMKNNFYRYFSEKKPQEFFIRLIEKA